MKFIKTVMTN